MKRSLILLVSLLVIGACVDRVDIPIIGEYSKDLVIDGLITDQPGPYTVKLSRVIRINDALPGGFAVTAKKVTLLDDAGNSEVLEETDKGVYQTNLNGIRGVVGRSYQIRVETFDGYEFESLADKMNPVGKVDSVYYEFETRQPADAPTEHGYRIYIDAHNMPGEDQYLRWKFNGTYVVETSPQYKLCLDAPCMRFDYCPLKCSGYAYDENGVLHKSWAYNPITKKVEYVIGLACTCCRCWVTPPEDKPRISDNQVSKEGKFNKVEMAYVPVNYYTFFEKYRAEIIQMSLSRAAFDYWRAVKSQKEGVGSLFQPVTGKIPTNLYEKNKALGIQGLFYAAAITKKHIYLDKETHKVEIYIPKSCAPGNGIREGAAGESCLLAFPGSITTTQQPVDWN